MGWEAEEWGQSAAACWKKIEVEFKQQSIEATDVDVAVKEILGAKPMGHSSEFDGDSETTSFQSNSGIICLMTKMMIVLCQKIKPEQFREKCLLWIK
ncbi:hypothetical protein Zmor_006903 [Zophobas morio]|uniref:Uncharacterized protein n=1 Tax=Zophobas morio TaxID=2755281 RepID=A0AA38IUK8_9CUCU|nr:hypothetical protein Zmor_006903 [Zophobas morio]